jgi:hypothetical protein
MRLFQALLAEFEAAGQDAEGALARIDKAPALAEQADQRWTDALLHRIPGDILLKPNPNPNIPPAPKTPISPRPREGFSSTPEMPEIAEAQALLAAIAAGARVRLK